MRFLYQYRTSDNVQHDGVINAASKEAAYALLKSQGIKPGRVTEAPGFLNKVLGKGKRWMTIGVLGVGCLVLGVVAVRARHEMLSARLDAEDRAQIYGDPGVLREAAKDGWAATFPDVGDRWLAAHAIPGLLCHCDLPDDFTKHQAPGTKHQAPDTIASALLAGRDRRIEIAETDLREIVQMKRMVNGLKDEMGRYLDAGGEIGKYMKRLCIRQLAEHGIYERMRNEIRNSSDTEAWRVKNQKLRAMGLPMVHE